MTGIATGIDPELEQRRALAALFLDQMRPAVIAHFLAAGGIATVGWMRTESLLPWVWYAGLVLILTGRMFLARRHRGRVESADASALTHIENGQALFAGLTGIGWGGFVWFAHPAGDLPLDALASALIMSNNGIAISSLAAIARAFPAFAWGSLIPIALKGFVIGDNINLTAAVAMFFAGAAMTAFNRSTHRAIVETIRLRYEKSQLVEQLQAEKAAAEEAYRVKSLFLAGVSHDLRHPLHALQLYLGYLKGLPADQPAGPGLAPAMPGMEGALSGMSGLLARLLDLSRLEAGEYQARLVTVSINDCFRACAASFSAKAEAKQLRLCLPPTRHAIHTDPQVLQSIVDNLVDNAIRHTGTDTDTGSVLVTLRGEGKGLRLDVRDSGSGIAPAHQLHLFEAYRRFDDSARERSNGYGLGLALVRKQCDLLGYRISLRSAIGCGSTFSVHIPATSLR